MIDDAADIAAMLADFGRSVTITRQSLGALTVTAIMTEATDAVNMMGVDIEAQEPTLQCATADVETVRRGDTTTIGGNAYTVERKQKIGTGFSVLYLKTS
jgi:hypothetical protein